jgi:hypothetical protein
MADCDLPAMQPLLAVFDAALAPIQPYLDFAFNQPALDAEIIAEITLQVAPPALPALPGIIQALQLVEVIVALDGMPPMPALSPLPAAGFGPLMPDGVTINLNWNPDVHGLAVIEIVVAMIAIPLDLIVGTLSLDPLAFPDIIIESLPDVPGAVALAECIEERLSMFAA